MQELYKGRTPQKEYEQLIEMLDTVFFTFDKEVPQREFLTLLPKLYKKEYDPCHNNFVVMEGADMCAAVGSYTHTIHAGGADLRIAGIGNVAVTLEHRSKGYMKDCMQLALDAMLEEQVDLSDLGGQKQRYGYFGYEPAGMDINFRVTATNLRHCCGKEAVSGLTVQMLTAADTAVFAQIDALYRSVAPYAERPLNAAFDILSSWRSAPYAAFEGSEFIGYFILTRGSDVSELRAADAANTVRLVMAAHETAQKDINITVSPYDLKTLAALYPLCENYELSHAHQYTVLNYERVIRAFLQESASIHKLCDGTLRLLIHGYAKDEQLEVCVRDSVVSVTPCEGDLDLELGHLDAIRLLFGLNSAHRAQLSPETEQWLPIPLFGFSADAV